jgi:hypothetical protein
MRLHVFKLLNIDIYLVDMSFLESARTFVREVKHERMQIALK